LAQKIHYFFYRVYELSFLLFYFVKPKTAQQFATKYTIIYRASYMFRPFSVIFSEVFDKEEEKHNVG